MLARPLASLGVHLLPLALESVDDQTISSLSVREPCQRRNPTHTFCSLQWVDKPPVPSNILVMLYDGVSLEGAAL